MEGPQVELTDIQRFYKGSVVFLTGATGFVGKLFLEKVLRALPVKKVYILVRAKKNIPADKRFNGIFDSKAFDLIRKTKPDALNKVCIMEGDCSLPNLGLSNQDRNTFIEEVNVVFHCAASVRFDEELKKATRTNVKATKDLVDLAKKSKKIKTFVYVGTAYSNSNRSEIKEEIYPPNITAEKLITACESLDETCLASMKDALIGEFPNTYTFTKQVTEDYIKREARGIPICITRPTIVTSTAKEPIAAFVDSFFTLAGFILTYALGVNRIAYSPNVPIDLIPADYVVNQCISAGWQTGENFKPYKTDIPVYNISSADNIIYQDDLYNIVDHYCRQVPPLKLLTYPLYFRTSYKLNYLFWRFFFHTLAAHAMDFLLKVQGKKPMYVQGIKKLHTFQEIYEPFTTKIFFFHVENTHKLLKRMSFKDRELFNFDIRLLNWEDYLCQYVRGGRIYLLQEPLETIPDGTKRYIYLKRVMTITLILLSILIYGLGKIFLFRVLPLVFRVIVYILRGMVC